MKIRKIIGILTAVICFVICMCAFTGCTESDKVNYNITQDAESFNVYRRVTVINCIKGDTLFEIEGLMNIEADREDDQLELIVEIEDGVYKKHFIGLSDNVTYTVEDISGSQTDKYHYEINYNPNMWIPFVPDYKD